MECREFDLSDILSVTTGFLVSTRSMEGIYDILGFMTDEKLFTHQLPRAADQCKPFFLLQYPRLVEIDCDEFGVKMKELAPRSENRIKYMAEWLNIQYERYGKTLSVNKLPAGENGKSDPIQELVDMVGKDKVITITMESE